MIKDLTLTLYYWPDIDEDISAEGMLYGTPAHRPKLGKIKYKKTRAGGLKYKVFFKGHVNYKPGMHD